MRALATRDVTQIEKAFDVLWYDMPSRFGPEILEAVHAFDAEVFQRPRMMHLALQAHHQQDYVGEDPKLGRVLQMFRTHGRRWANRLNDFNDLAELQTAGTIALISSRLDGAYRRAEQLGTWLDDRLSGAGGGLVLPWSAQHVVTRPGWLSTQRGLTATLAGDLDYAIHLYTRGFNEAGSPPRGHFAGANSAANLALIAAFRGHLDLARVWIDRMESSGPLPDWIEHLTALGAKIAASLIAIEEGDAAGAKHHLARIGPTNQHVELWPFIAYARGTFEACYGDPHQGLADLEAARLNHGALTPTGHGVTRDLLLHAEARLLLRTDPERVLHLARIQPEDFPHQYAALAHLSAGHPHEAIRVAARALNRSSSRLPLSDVIELQLTTAVAHLRNGNEDRAITAFRAAARQRSTLSHVRPFLLASRHDVATLAALADVPDPLHELQSDVSPNPVHAVTLVHLTPRELAVLQSLDRGETAVAAAQRFGVSLATVRSQIASIYRKIGASGRGATLARAHELGLLSSKERDHTRPDHYPSHSRGRTRRD